MNYPYWHYPAPINRNDVSHALATLYAAAHSYQHDEAHAILSEFFSRSTYHAPANAMPAVRTPAAPNPLPGTPSTRRQSHL